MPILYQILVWSGIGNSCLQQLAGAMTEVVIKVVGNYSYHSNHCLGQGVYGRVFEGVDRTTKDKVAIKKIDLAIFSKDRYLQNAVFSEIYLLKRFSHPNIIRFKDVLTSKTSLYIVTELCKDGDLSVSLRNRVMKENEAFQVITQILQGFTELVKEKIVHRDLKPANILVHDGVYKIGDFGFAKHVDKFGTQMLKSCVGSPIYMAPQILSRQEYSTKCDIWSIGVMFFQMIFGRHPWTARDEVELLKTIQIRPIGKILERESVSLKVGDFLRKCLEYNEVNRVTWEELFETYLDKVQITKPLVFQPYERSASLNGRIASRAMTPRAGNSRVSGVNKSKRSSSSDKNIGPPVRVNSNKEVTCKNDHFEVPIERVRQGRGIVVYKHYLLVQLSEVQKPDNLQPLKWSKLLFLLGESTRLRSTYLKSLLSILMRSHKGHHDLQETMQKEHTFYEEMERDIQQTFPLIADIKREFQSGGVARIEVINEERILKLENILNQLALEFARILLPAIKNPTHDPPSSFVYLLQLLAKVVTIGTGNDSSLLECSLNGEYTSDSPSALANLTRRVEHLCNERTIAT